MGRAVLTGIFAVFAMAASAAPTLIVAVDRSGENSHDIAELGNTIDEAIAAQHHWIDIDFIQGGITVTIGDTQADRAVVAALENAFRSRKDVAMTVSPARAFRFRSLPVPSDYEKRQTLFAKLDRIIQELRPPLPGVSIEDLPDGAVVRVDNGNVEDLLKRTHFSDVVVMKPVSPVAAHVAWHDAGKLAEKYTIGQVLSYALRDPLDFELQVVGEDAGFVIPDTAQHGAFIAAVRKGFAAGAPFAMRETSAVVMQFTLQDGKPHTVDAPDKAVWGVMNEVGGIADPRLTNKKDGDAFVIWTTSSTLAAQRLSEVRTALSARKDLVVTQTAKHAVHVTLAPGAHLFAPLPPQDDAQMAAAVQARAAALKLAVTIMSAGSERATVAFATDKDRERFREAITRGRHLQLRLVDMAADGGKPPEPGSEKLPFRAGSQEGAFLWLKPDVILTGDVIASAQAETERYTGRTLLMIHLNDEGKSLFAVATKEHVGERLAIVIDGVVVTAPTVREPILAGAVQVEGNFTPEEARDLAAKIVPEQGAVPLRIVTETP